MYFLNAIRGWKPGKLKESKPEDMLSYLSESGFEFDMVIIMRNISIFRSEKSDEASRYCDLQ